MCNFSILCSCEWTHIVIPATDSGCCCMLQRRRCSRMRATAPSTTTTGCSSTTPTNASKASPSAATSTCPPSPTVESAKHLHAPGGGRLIVARVVVLHSSVAMATSHQTVCSFTAVGLDTGGGAVAWTGSRLTIMRANRWNCRRHCCLHICDIGAVAGRTMCTELATDPGSGVRGR